MGYGSYFKNAITVYYEINHGLKLTGRGFRHGFYGDVYFNDEIVHPLTLDYKTSGIWLNGNRAFAITSNTGAQGLLYTSCLSVGISEKILLLWGTAKLSSGAAVQSDCRLKHDISSLSSDERYEELFNSVNPVSFIYNDGASGRRHTGFIAQQVKEALLGAGFTTQEIAAYLEIESDAEGMDGYECAIRYEEFIPINMLMIKKCLRLIAQQQVEINELKGV